MAKGLAPIFFTACGVVVAGVVGYSVIQPGLAPKSEAVSQIETTPTPEANTNENTQQLAKLEVPEQEEAQNDVNVETDTAAEPEQPVEKIEVLPVRPTFDVVRVERDGSTVIAGEGPVNEIVELIDGEVKIAETKVNSTGEFVFVLDKPLEPGPHELFLRVMPKEGEPIQSSSFAFVDVPKPGAIGEVTVLLAEAGKPSQVLQKPEPQEIAKADVVEEAEVPKNSSPEQEEVQENEKTEEVTATAESSVTLADPDVVSENSEVEVEAEETKQEVAAIEEPETSVSEPVEVEKLAPVLIEAADVENGKIFIAGTGEPLTSINIYLDNELLGTAQVAENGAFLFEGSKQIEAGRYDIRADMTKGGASVLARAEVTLVHEPQVAAVEEPKEIIEETSEPEPEIQEEEIAGQPSVEEETDEQVVTSEVQPAPEPEPELKPETDVAAVEAETEIKVEVEEEPVTTEAPKKEIQTGSAVIIRRGDNLWRVARRNYGAGIRYTTIFDANRDQVRNPDLIYPGQVLKIPESEQSTE